MIRRRPGWFLRSNGDRSPYRPYPVSPNHAPAAPALYLIRWAISSGQMIFNVCHFSGVRTNSEASIRLSGVPPDVKRGKAGRGPSNSHRPAVLQIGFVNIGNFELPSRRRF